MQIGKALRSKHIFLNDQEEPIDGYLLLQGEKVEKVVPYKAVAPNKLALEYVIFDYSELYVFPGLIDTNVHLNSTYEDSWNDVQNITKMAAQGGITTILDSPIMSRMDVDQNQTISLRVASLNNKVFVDVGLMAYLDNGFQDLIQNPAVIGFKGYLSPPMQNSIPKLNLHILYKIKKELDKLVSPCVFCINCEEANERDLFMASPLRGFEKKTRLDPKVDIKDFRAFGGGHQGTLNEDISSNTSNNEEENDKVFDLMLEANRINENSNNQNNELKSPTTADLKIVSLLEARKQDEKYIAQQEYDQYKCDIPSEEKEPFEEEVKTFDSLNPLNSSLELSEEISQDFSEAKSEEVKIEEDKEKETKKKQFFHENPLKNLIANSIMTEKVLGSGVIDDQFNMLYSKQDIDSERDMMQCSVMSIEEVNRNYSQSPTKKGGILERRLRTKTLIENNPENLTNKKRSATSDPKNFIKMRKINTIKETNEIVAREEEKQRCRVYKNFLFNHPLAWETSGIHLLLKVLKNVANCNILLSNLSSASLAYLIREERKKSHGLPFFVDTSIPYIFFSLDMIKDGQTKFKVSPPIRDKSEGTLIVKSLKKGVFDTVSSFHLQTPETFKNIEKGNFRRAFNGISCIGYNLCATWTRLYSLEKGKIKRNKVNANTRGEMERSIFKIFKMLIRTMSKKPAEIFQLSHQKGDLAPGKDADILVWNPFVVKKVERDDILLKYPKMFVFRGYKMYGEVVATFLRGDIIFQKDKEGKDFIQRGKVLKRGVNI